MIAKMQHTMGNKATIKFLETLKRRSPETVSKFADLSMTGEGFKGLSEMPDGADRDRSMEASKFGANDAFTLTEKQGRNKDQLARKFYHKVKQYELNEMEESGQPQELGTKRKIYKEVYMPMIAAGLGINQLPLSARVDTSKGVKEGFAGTRFKSKGTMNEIIEGGQDLLKVNEDGGSRFNQIDPNQLQKLMVFDLLFENQDAHFRQYILNNDNHLFKVDNEDYLKQDSESDTKAGSFLAGLPLANRQMTDETINLIRNWDSKYLKEMMQDAAFNYGSGENREREGLFNKDQINQVMSNLKDLKLLAEESELSGLSAREVWDLYNSRDESGKMTGNMVNRQLGGYLKDWRPAKYNNHMGTRLPFENDTLFENLDKDEAREADKLAELRDGNPVDLTGFKRRLKHHYDLPELSARYREKRSIHRQVMTPRLERERFMQADANRLTSLSVNLDNNMMNQLLTDVERDS